MLADLDAALRRLLEAELADHGFDGVRVSFEAPTSQWAAGLTAPTLDLFLYDLREAADVPVGGWSEHRGNGPARLERPALRLECSYSVTAWTREAEDEHRLLSQTLAVLLAHTRLPDRVLGERLAEASAAQGPIMTRIGQPKGDHKAEFWTAVGGRYRVSLDYVVTLSIVPGVTLQRGPEVRTHTVRMADRGAGVRPPFERHSCGGIVPRQSDSRWPTPGSCSPRSGHGRPRGPTVASRSPVCRPEGIGASAGRAAARSSPPSCWSPAAASNSRPLRRSSSPTGILAVRSGMDTS